MFIYKKKKAYLISNEPDRPHAGRGKKSYKTGKADFASRIRLLTVVRIDKGYKAVVSLCFILMLSACGNNGSPTGSQQSAASTETAQTSGKKTILFFGDSLTAGYGLDDPSDAFPGVIQGKIDSLKLPYTVINAGVSGETTAGGLGRIDWILKQKVDVFVLELGANDGLRGIPVNETTENLQAIIDKVKARYPDAKLVLVGMQVPPSMGSDYVTSFKDIFPRMAEKNKVTLVPFLLAGVGGNPGLNQADGIHPTAEGAKIVAGNVWKVLKEEL
ncbi:MAG: arylesterase [Mucilaginibacter sp.]|nr:arylesterase [Mucilaginibacter sp.]